MMNSPYDILQLAAVPYVGPLGECLHEKLEREWRALDNEQKLALGRLEFNRQFEEEQAKLQSANLKEWIADLRADQAKARALVESFGANSG